MLRFRIRHLLIAQLIVCLVCANIQSIKTYSNYKENWYDYRTLTVNTRYGLPVTTIEAETNKHWVTRMATNTPVYLREEWILKFSNEGEDEFGPNYKVMFEIIWGGIEVVPSDGRGEVTHLWVGYRDSNDEFNWLPWGH